MARVRKPEASKIAVKGLTYGKVEVSDENRQLELKNGVFSDDFQPYAVYRCRIG